MSSGLVFWYFFFSKPQILHWFKHWKFNLVHTHLPVTNSTNNLIKFQSFQRWNKEENGEFFHPIHMPELDGILTSSSTYDQFCLPNLSHSDIKKPFSCTIFFPVLNSLLHLMSLQVHPKSNLNLLFSEVFFMIYHVWGFFSNSFALKVHLVQQ